MARASQGRPGRTRSEKTFVFRALAAVVLPFMNLVGQYRVHGGENLPTRGACVISPNHYTEIDPLVVAVVVWKSGRAPRFLAKASLFRIPVVGRILRATGQIPVERHGGRGSDPLAAARKLAERELAVIIYPEGSLTREPDMWPMRGKTGAVRMALQADVPLIPVAHWGAQQIMPRYGKRVSLFPRKKVDVAFGPPVNLDDLRGRPLDPTMLAQGTERLMTAITALLEELRGEKAPAERWDPTERGQRETGRF